MMSFIKRVRDKLNSYLRRLINRANRKKLTNTQPCVISSNCTGAFILHDLGCRFRSPFVNLYLKPKDFIKYLNNIPYYQNQPLRFLTQSGKRYPVGQLGDLTIHFMHYHSEEEARQKWQERTQRMDLEQPFIIMSERDGCSYQDLLEFEQLPFKHKVVFTHKAYPELASAYHIKGFEDQGMIGDLFEYTGLTGKRYYDQFDYVAWFNQMR